MLLLSPTGRSTFCALIALLFTLLSPVAGSAQAEEATPIQPIPSLQNGAVNDQGADPAPISADPEQQLIQQRLEQLYYGPVDTTDQEPIYTAAYLLDLYRKNHFAPLWTNKNNITQLISAIIGGAEEGFIPDDYHLKTINQYFNEPLETMSISHQVEYDLLLSDAFILLGQHKRYGKVDPSKVDEKQNLETTTPRTSPVDTYLNAIQTGTVRAALDQLSPHHQAYVAMKEALRRYKNIAGSGGWPQVPSGPSLRPGMRDTRVPALRRRLLITDDYRPATAHEKGNLYDQALVNGVKAFQKRHHLESDGVVGTTTVGAMNITAEERIKQIRVNLERTRWIIHDLPSSNLIVDIAGFMLQYYHNNQQVWTSKVMVGKPYHQTPIFRSAITYIVLNPTWTITPDIIKNETVPSIINDPAFLARQRLRVLDREGNEVDSNSIPWSQYRGKYFPYTLRQDAGRDNALGMIKFLFPNPYHVYLHDTPSKSLFGRTRRAFSHGCIRVQNPLDLGRLILTNDPGNPTTPERMDRILASGKTTTVILKQPLPIYLMYLTTNVSDGKVMFKPDLYNRDNSIFAALNAQPSPLKLNTQVPEVKGQPSNQQASSIRHQHLVQIKEQKAEDTYAQDTL
ncbi:MAG: L,D-transpeptidase family protein [Desulfobulbus sp.]|nr:L,D-transpeptidase family protein [Desulfobulbus sp.]